MPILTLFLLQGIMMNSHGINVDVMNGDLTAKFIQYSEFISLDESSFEFNYLLLGKQIYLLNHLRAVNRHWNSVIDEDKLVSKVQDLICKARQIVLRKILYQYEVDTELLLYWDRNKDINVEFYECLLNLEAKCDVLKKIFWHYVVLARYFGTAFHVIPPSIPEFRFNRETNTITIQSLCFFTYVYCDYISPMFIYGILIVSYEDKDKDDLLQLSLHNDPWNSITLELTPLNDFDINKMLSFMSPKTKLTIINYNIELYNNNKFPILKAYKVFIAFAIPTSPSIFIDLSQLKCIYTQKCLLKIGEYTENIPYHCEAGKISGKMKLPLNWEIEWSSDPDYFYKSCITWKFVHLS